MLLTTQQGPVRVLTLNRPEAMNALTGELAAGLAAAVAEAEGDAATRVVVITGAGERAFCAGADLKERRAMGPAQKWEQACALRRVNEAIWRSPKAFVAAVNGWALGGGFELALHCDLRIAAEHAQFGFPEMTLGGYPGAGGAVILPRLIGRAASRRFFYTATRVGAQEALGLGVLERVVPAAQLSGAALALATSIAENTSPLGFAAAKRVLNEGADLPFEQASLLDQSLREPLEATEDYAEGLRAQLEKRKPRFTGR